MKSELEGLVNELIFVSYEWGDACTNSAENTTAIARSRDTRWAKQRLLDYVSMYYKPRVPEKSYHHGEE